MDPNATDGNLQKINNFYLHFLEKCLLAALKISHRNNLVSVNFKTLLSENNLTMLQIKGFVQNHISADKSLNIQPEGLHQIQQILNEEAFLQTF